MTSIRKFFAIAASALALGCSAAKPEAVYDGGFGDKCGPSCPIRLRIANGGAGQSGLIKGVFHRH